MRRIVKGKNLRTLAAAMMIATSALPSLATNAQVNGAGATLFVDFSAFQGITNDWIDVDSDTFFGFYDSDSDTIPDAVDQLAPTGGGGEWVVQYRSVGSVEGFAEFVTYQTCGDLPENIPTERGVINRSTFANLGVTQVPAGWVGSPCTADTDGDGINNFSGTYVCWDSVDLANLDVPAVLAVRVGADPGDCAWNRKPGTAGYGTNSRLAYVLPGCTSAFPNTNELASLSSTCTFGPNNGQTITLNTNVANPDANTLFDTTIAWSPVAYIANRGTNLDIDKDGVEDGAIRMSELQHLYVTGRLKNGENLVGATRDVGSGTRNAAMNSIGVDPSWGIGDNRSPRNADDTTARLGDCHQATNSGGSGIIEVAVQSRRLAIGYTGVLGSSRASGDSRAGLYELLGVMKDIDGNGDTVIDGNQVVRVTLNSILTNGNANTGWQIGGVQTFVTRGDPRAEAFGPRAPQRTFHGQLMANKNAAKFIRNIEESIIAFDGNPNLDINKNMPGDILARNFIPFAAPDTTASPSMPTMMVGGNQVALVKSYVETNNSLKVGGSLEPAAYGDSEPANGATLGPAGKVPFRRARVAPYTDGSTTGEYYYKNGVGTVVPIAGGTNRLSQRNRVQGDFNNDGHRDINDIARLVEAYWFFNNGNPADDYDFEPIQGGLTGSMSVDRLIVHVVGDYDGDGNFNKADVRYHADGLALVDTNPSPTVFDYKLNRKQGFINVDSAWLALAAPGGVVNFFGTTLATPKVYAAGDSRGDVAGNASGARPGDDPAGADGIVNAADIDYVCHNYVSAWSNTDLAACKDLSADMDGDLDVDAADVAELVEVILGTHFGDVNLDGVVNNADKLIAQGNLGNPGGWAQGDMNCDGQVTSADITIILCNGALTGDANCDGLVNNFDIDPFVQGLLNSQAGYLAVGGTQECFDVRACWGDIDNSGAFNNFDIDPFVACLLAPPPPNSPCP